MEPFRPIVDREVRSIVTRGAAEVDIAAKQTLARVMILDVPTNYGLSPLMICAERLAQSLVHAFAGETDRLELPLPFLPLEG